MKLPLTWIKEYVPLTVDPQIYMDEMTMKGVAVESIFDISKEIRGVIVGKIENISPIPNSDHLTKCKVNIGKSDLIDVVCGAPNVRVGVLVPVATVGAILPGNFKIEKVKIRGVDSHGMLCSSTELGIPIDLYPSVGDAGILIFNEDYPPGSDIRPILGLDDTIIEFDILANRPDCLSVWGISRETAAIFNLSFEKPVVKVREISESILDYMKISVESPEFCPRYTARLIKNIKISPSPLWLRKYLNNAGVRSINNIVDITNFIMIETGHPMHAFDFDKIANHSIVVREASKGETISTLDDKKHILSGNELLICDGNGPTGLAGIMGGLDSEITENTKNVVFECAAFDRTNIRLTSKRLGIRTESSGRFEKGVSPATVEEAMNRACQLVNMLNAGDVLKDMIDIYPIKHQPNIIRTTTSYIRARSGVDIPSKKMVSILEKLYFKVELEGDNLTITPPDFRQDMDGPADICEEILRIYGFEHIPSNSLRGATTQGKKSFHMLSTNMIQNILSSLGYFEIMKFSFISQKSIGKLRLSLEDSRNNPIKILNPLGEETSVMRTSLVPSLLEALSHNQSQGNKWAKLYEIAPVFNNVESTKEGLPREDRMISIGAYGPDVDFYSMKAALLTLFKYFGVSPSLENTCENYHHPGRCASFILKDNVIASFGELHPEVSSAFALNNRCYIAEINFELLQKNYTSNFKILPLPKYPAIVRDIALVMKNDIAIGDVINTIKQYGGELLVKCDMFDIYKGSQLNKDLKSVAFNLTFRSNTQTLLEEDINILLDKILAATKKLYDAKLRE